MRLRKPTRLLASTALTLAACVISSCGAGATSSSSPRAAGSGASSLSASPTASPVRFHSPEYGYSLTLPAGWTANQAYSTWDGRTELSYESFDVDHFLESSSRFAFGVAARWKHGLASYGRFLIASTNRYHGDFCPPKPDAVTRVAIGGESGVLLEYNCGILVNMAATVRHGVGYVFVFRDNTVQAASDPSDHAVFAQMLRSVEFSQ